MKDRKRLGNAEWGQKVVCVNDDMGSMKCVAIKPNGIYTVKEHLSLEEYEKRHPDCGWWLKGKTREEFECGLVYLEEVLGDDGSDLEWLASRFQPAQ